MKKIKKFKIQFRPRDIVRMLKATGAVGEVTPQLEEAVQREIARIAPLVSTAALYETRAVEKFPTGIVVPPAENWVAASALLVTIGADVEEEIRAARQRDEALVGSILHAVAVEGLDQACSFVQRLINEEAKAEDCELSRQQTVTADGLPALLALLPGDRVGITMTAPESFSPVYSSCGVVFWHPLKKRRK